jgi:hypothetical protein
MCFLTCRRYHEKQGDAAPDDFGARNAAREAVLGKGQSKRIWAELYKVVDSSDVIVQVGNRRSYHCLSGMRPGNGAMSGLMNGPNRCVTRLQPNFAGQLRRTVADLVPLIKRWAVRRSIGPVTTCLCGQDGVFASHHQPRRHYGKCCQNVTGTC